ncbi:MAG: class IV adenylate cyclase, partial [Promethearchaeota archaeon]
MIEAEIKVKISDPDEMKNKFRNFHGKHILTLYHEDTYFNMPLKLRDFRKTDEALRIRKSTEFDPSNEGKSIPKINFFITYKGRKIDSTTKTRNEWETQVQDGEIMKTILKSLGFREIFTVKKEREFYEFIFNGE